MFDTIDVYIVPKKKTLDNSLTLNKGYTVKWMDGKKFAAELLFLGKF